MDLSTAAGALSSIQGLTYSFILILFIIEGPILNYVAAFAASLGAFNVFIIFGLAVLGNFIGDMIYYYIGKVSHATIVKKYVKKSLNSKKALKTKKFLETHPGKAMALIKLAPFIPTAGLIFVGMTKMPLKKFLFYSLLINILSCAFITILGFYSGLLFGVIFKYIKFSAYLIALGVVVVLLSWLATRYFIKKLSKRLEQDEE